MFQALLPEPGRKPGGVDVFVHRLGHRLATRGHSVRMISYSPAPNGSAYEHQLLSSAIRPTKLQRMCTVPVKLNSLDVDGLDVLHLHGDDWFFVRRTLPTIRSFYGSALHEARHATRLRRRVSQLVNFGLELLSARLATRSYSVGPGWPRLYALDGLLNCGVEICDESQPRRSESPSILFVGTWHGRKRGRLLAEIFSRDIKPRHPEAELWMVSDEARAGDGVTAFCGLSDAELVELYRQAWVFCLPSTYEGFGIPYIEAMAHGTPIVTSPNVGSHYVLGDCKAGLIVGDHELGDTLISLISDDKRRAEMGGAGRIRARDFAWDSVLDAYEHAYEQTIAAWRT